MKEARMCLWAICCVALSLFGCVTYVAQVPSVNARAFIVRSQLGGSSLWNCDATNGQPVCFETTKE